MITVETIIRQETIVTDEDGHILRDEIGAVVTEVPDDPKHTTVEIPEDRLSEILEWENTLSFDERNMQDFRRSRTFGEYKVIVEEAYVPPRVVTIEGEDSSAVTDVGELKRLLVE
jgi:hypothetical protein